MRVLLVWEEVPEDLQFFALTDPTPEQLAVLEKANGLYINGLDMTEEETQAIDHVNAALSKPEYSKDMKGEEDWASIWFGGKIENELLPTAGGFDRVFTCGFYL